MTFSHITGHEEHPVIEMPDPADMASLTPANQEIVWENRKQAITAMLSDPLRFGYESTSWKRADRVLKDFRNEYPVGVIIFLVLGGHRASKTEWRSKRTVENLFANPDYKIWACQKTQEASRESQQIPIYKYLPPEYRNESGKMRKGKTLKVNYTPWSGFTEDVFAVQNRHGGTSECRFKFYSMDPKALEGAEINEGWADEEATLEWIEALIYRLVSRNGILYLTFTPRWGYTQTVKTILQGAVTLEEGETDIDLVAVRDAKGNVISAKKVPLVQKNDAIEIPGHKIKGRIVYFHTAENPYPLGNWQNAKATLIGANEDKILTTAYGVPTRAYMAKFPKFKDGVHVISLNRFREIQAGGGTWFHFLDPCSGRNWFQIWIFLDVTNRAFVVGESPSFGHQWAYIPGVGDPGPWATAGIGNKKDGEMGEGQKEWGWGYDRYLEEMDRIERILSGGTTPQKVQEPEVSTLSEEKITISARWIDARYGNARRTTEERSVTLIEDMEAKGMIFLAAPSEKFLYDESKGGASVRMINDRLFYDEARPIDHTNQPKLYVVETCPNTIWALHEWTGDDGQHGACKDPIDTLRMFVLSGSEYVDESLLQPRTPWMSQFGK